jgi:hypothetical protein
LTSPGAARRYNVHVLGRQPGSGCKISHRALVFEGHAPEVQSLPRCRCSGSKNRVCRWLHVSPFIYARIISPHSRNTGPYYTENLPRVYAKAIDTNPPSWELFNYLLVDCQEVPNGNRMVYQEYAITPGLPRQLRVLQSLFLRLYVDHWQDDMTPTRKPIA